MKKTMLLLVLLAALCALAMTPALAEGETSAGYVEQATKVVKDDAEDGELTLRFYDATPHVAYMGFGAYWQYMNQQPLTLRDDGDGVFTLVNDIGAELIVDVEADTITAPDWNRFFDAPLPIETTARGWKDYNMPFVRIVDVTYEGEAAPVTLDLGKYGIQIYADQDDIYLPLSTLSNITTDIGTRHMLYNGDKLYSSKIDLSFKGNEEYYGAEAFKVRMQGAERPDDMIRQCYADLCFIFDNFFGHPGVSIMDQALAEKGFDQALTDLGEEGLAIKEGLHSKDLATYLSSMNRLFMHYLNDGHTSASSDGELLEIEATNLIPDFRKTLSGNYMTDLFSSPKNMRVISSYTIPLQRHAIWGSETYREYGSTAIIRLDQFAMDLAAWNSFYNGEAEMPQDDDFSAVVNGLKKASENPEIKNVIFDISCNGGGSSDMLAAILAMTTGQDKLYGISKLTGRKMIITYETDVNFDGVYDEKDKAARYDFNYGVLTTRYAFSCGNLFPIVMQEGGAVIIGEPTSGGGCCVQLCTDSEGFHFIMSSAQWQLLDSQGNGVEQGCSVDLPIDAPSDYVTDVLVSLLGVNNGIHDFSCYYDDANLDAMMNAWFADQAELDLAA